jgi:hypothetical protein
MMNPIRRKAFLSCEARPKSSRSVAHSPAHGKSNDRITVEPRDLPITKGLQESIHAFEKLDLDIGPERILDETVPEPQIDLPYSEETEARLPAIAGGLSLALARTFKIIDPEVKHPATLMWERAFEVFNLLL